MVRCAGAEGSEDGDAVIDSDDQASDDMAISSEESGDEADEDDASDDDVGDAGDVMIVPGADSEEESEDSSEDGNDSGPDIGYGSDSSVEATSSSDED